jgi:hypothetical protein
MIYVLWGRQALPRDDDTASTALEGDLKKKLGSNLRLTFWAIAALSIPRAGRFIAIAAQVHANYTASVWRDRKDVPIAIER